jgi:uncharacterized protein (DUF2126 family)
VTYANNGRRTHFVSIDDFEGAEWNTAADGPLKRKLAYDLALRLKQICSRGFIHFGQGKWYPGELFPQYALYWRKDGLPLWKTTL